MGLEEILAISEGCVTDFNRSIQSPSGATECVASKRPDTDRPSPQGGVAASQNSRDQAHRPGRHLKGARRMENFHMYETTDGGIRLPRPNMDGKMGVGAQKHLTAPVNHGGAQRELSPVGRGMELTRPLQRVEIDDWTVDLMKLLAESGVTQSRRRRTGATRRKSREAVAGMVRVGPRGLRKQLLRRVSDGEELVCAEALQPFIQTRPDTPWSGVAQGEWSLSHSCFGDTNGSSSRCLLPTHQHDLGATARRRKQRSRKK